MHIAIGIDNSDTFQAGTVPLRSSRTRNVSASVTYLRTSTQIRDPHCLHDVFKLASIYVPLFNNCVNQLPLGTGIQPPVVEMSAPSRVPPPPFAYELLGGTQPCILQLPFIRLSRWPFPLQNHLGSSLSCFSQPVRLVLVLTVQAPLPMHYSCYRFPHRT